MGSGVRRGSWGSGGSLMSGHVQRAEYLQTQRVCIFQEQVRVISVKAAWSRHVITSAERRKTSMFSWCKGPAIPTTQIATHTQLSLSHDNPCWGTRSSAETLWVQHPPSIDQSLENMTLWRIENMTAPLLERMEMLDPLPSRNH